MAEGLSVDVQRGLGLGEDCSSRRLTNLQSKPIAAVSHRFLVLATR